MKNSKTESTLKTENDFNVHNNTIQIRIDLRTLEDDKAEENKESKDSNQVSRFIKGLVPTSLSDENVVKHRVTNRTLNHLQLEKVLSMEKKDKQK